MRILVIGNGFDLAHGLATSYRDFLDFISTVCFEDNLPPRLRNRKQDPELHAFIEACFEATNWDMLTRWVAPNFWIHHFRDDALHHNNWVDFESEILGLIKRVDAYKKMDTASGGDLDLSATDTIYTIHDYYSLYGVADGSVYGENEVDIRRIIALLEEDLWRLVLALEFYLARYINHRPVAVQPLFEALNFDRVISFNYTGTHRRLYDENGEIEYDFIHGVASEDRPPEANNMVLGIEEYLSGDDANLDTDFIAFKKYFQRIYKGTGRQYKKWLDAIEASGEPSEIYFFGHSLCEADKDIVGELFGTDDAVVKKIVFYHDRASYRSQIENLVRIIGRQTLIEKTYSADPAIIFEHAATFHERQMSTV